MNLFHTPPFSGRELTRDDIGLLQAFFDANPTYFECIGGAPATATEAAELFDELPPAGWPYTRRWLIGVFDGSGELAGMTELVADLLAPGVWHVGLLIVATARHGTGDAQLIWQGLTSWMRQQGAQWLRLGVVESNPRGLRFWRRQGFIVLRDRQGVEIAGRLHRVHVLARPVGAGLIEDYLARVPRDAPELPDVSLLPAVPADADALAELRVQAMQPSLERIGRFEPQRARQRLLAGFDAQHTRWIVAAGQQVGFLVLRPGADAWLLDHLYVRPGHQGQGIGAAVMRRVLAEVDAAGAALRVVALRGSDANRFYLRHGFGLVEEAEHDLHYLRPAAATRPAGLHALKPAAD